MTRIVVLFSFLFVGVNLFSQNASRLNSTNTVYFFGQNENNSFDYEIVEEQIEKRLEMPKKNLDELLEALINSATNSKGLAGALLMVGGAGLMSIPLSPNITLSDNTAKTFLISGVIIAVTGFVLYVIHFNDGQQTGKVRRRDRKKKKYNPSDWEITTE